MILDGSVQSQRKLTAWRDGDERRRPSSALVNAVDALAVEAVLESQADCADLERARAALSEALVAARAPAHGGSRLRGSRATGPSAEPHVAGGAHWTMTMTVAPSPVNVSARSAGTKSAEAVIVDDAGTIVAQRTLSDRNARACLPLARAVGAWATLVLDAEMVRAKDEDGTVTTPASGDDPTGPSASKPQLRLVRTYPDEDTASSTEGEHATPQEQRALEIGSMVYVRNGLLATGGMAGVSPFVAVELASAWVLRPSLAFGRTTERAVGISHVGGRADICRRIPGNYTERRGIEADLCAGFEAGVVTSQAGQTTRGDSVGRAGVGPAATLRGELAGGVALEVRGLVGANFIQSALLGQAEAPLVFAAAELGISVRLP
jgi:hypothetical protein